MFLFFWTCAAVSGSHWVSTPLKRADACHLCGRVVVVGVAAAIIGCCLCCLSSGSQPPSLAGAPPQRRPREGWAGCTFREDSVYFLQHTICRWLVLFPADSDEKWRISPQGGNSINVARTNRHAALSHVKDNTVVPQGQAQGDWRYRWWLKQQNAAFGCCWSSY